MRRVFLVMLVAASLAGWKWDDKADAANINTGNCNNGQTYYLMPGPYGNGFYTCIDGRFYGPQ